MAGDEPWPPSRGLSFEEARRDLTAPGMHEEVVAARMTTIVGPVMPDEILSREAYEANIDDTSPFRDAWAAVNLDAYARLRSCAIIAIGCLEPVAAAARPTIIEPQNWEWLLAYKGKDSRAKGGGQSWVRVRYYNAADIEAWRRDSRPEAPARGVARAGDPGPGAGAGQVTLAAALLARISDDDRAAVERGLAENLRRTLLVLGDAGSEAERERYSEFAACWHRAYDHLVEEVKAGTCEVWGIWEKPTLGTALEKIDTAMLSQLLDDTDYSGQLADRLVSRVIRHVVVRARQDDGAPSPAALDGEGGDVPRTNRGEGGKELFVLIRLAIDDADLSSVDFDPHGFKTWFAKKLLAGSAKGYKPSAIERTLREVIKELREDEAARAK